MEKAEFKLGFKSWRSGGIRKGSLEFANSLVAVNSSIYYSHFAILVMGSNNQLDQWMHNSIWVAKRYQYSSILHGNNLHLGKNGNYPWQS